MDDIVISGTTVYRFILSLWHGILQAIYQCLNFPIVTVSGVTITPWLFLVWTFVIGLFISAIIKNAKV